MEEPEAPLSPAMDLVYKRVSGLSESEGGGAKLYIQESTVLSGEEVPFYGAADERNIQMEGETLRILNREMQLESPLPSPGAPIVTQVLISGREEPEAPLSPAMDVVLKRVSGFSESEGDAELSIQKSTAGSVRVLSGEEVPFYGAADERNIQMQGEILKVLNCEMQLESLLPSSGLSIYGKEASVSSLCSSGLGHPGAPIVTEVCVYENDLGSKTKRPTFRLGSPCLANVMEIPLGLENIEQTETYTKEPEPKNASYTIGKRGTCVIGLISPYGILMAADGRVTLGEQWRGNRYQERGEIYEGSYKKLICMSNSVLASLCGNLDDCEELLQHINYILSNVHDKHIYAVKRACQRVLRSWHLTHNDRYEGDVILYGYYSGYPCIFCTQRGWLTNAQSSLGLIVGSGSGFTLALDYVSSQLQGNVQRTAVEYFMILKTAVAVAGLQDLFSGGAVMDAAVWRRGGNAAIVSVGVHMVHFLLNGWAHLMRYLSTFMVIASIDMEYSFQNESCLKKVVQWAFPDADNLDILSVNHETKVITRLLGFPNRRALDARFGHITHSSLLRFVPGVDPRLQLYHMTQSLIASVCADIDSTDDFF